MAKSAINKREVPTICPSKGHTPGIGFVFWSALYRAPVIASQAIEPGGAEERFCLRKERRGSRTGDPEP